MVKSSLFEPKNIREISLAFNIKSRFEEAFEKKIKT